MSNLPFWWQRHAIEVLRAIAAPIEGLASVCVGLYSALPKYPTQCIRYANSLNALHCDLALLP